MQTGFCANFSDFDAKSCSPKNAPKNRMFSPNFSTEFFPEFSVCAFLQKEQQLPPKNGLQKFSQKIHHGAEQNPECRCGRAGSPSIYPFDKQNFSRKTPNSSVRSSAALCLTKEGYVVEKGETTVLSTRDLLSQDRQKSTEIRFLSLETVLVFHARGWGSKISFSPSKSRKRTKDIARTSREI